MPSAIKHFTTEFIENFLECGDGDGLLQLLEDAVAKARLSPDGVATVQFFVDYEPDEEDDSDEDSE